MSNARTVFIDQISLRLFFINKVFALLCQKGITVKTETTHINCEQTETTETTLSGVRSRCDCLRRKNRVMASILISV